MKKLFTVLTAFIFVTTAFAQNNDSTISKAPVVHHKTKKDTTGTKVGEAPKSKDWTKIDLSHRANDHFMVQIGYDNWLGKPDTLQIIGFCRSFNFYFMYDFPFKTDKRLSAAAGLGIGNSNIFFSSQPTPISATPQQNASGGSHFKKYKVVTTFLEIPVELRFALDPENTNKSWKFAIGAKVGFLLSAYGKGKDVLGSSGQIQDASTYKDSNKAYYNGTKLAGTMRISKGPVGIFGQISATSLLKASAGQPVVYPFSIGICLSGL